MEILFATHPEMRPEHGHVRPVSTIPPELQTGQYRFKNAVWSTHRDHRTTAQQAGETGDVFVCDMEMTRAALDQWVYDKQTCLQNMRRRRLTMDGIQRMVRPLPTERGLYSSIQIGLLRRQFTRKDLIEFAKKEADELRACTYALGESYISYLVQSREAQQMDEWRMGVDTYRFMAEVQKREFIALVAPFVHYADLADLPPDAEDPDELGWAYVPRLWNEQLDFLSKEGIRTMSWIPWGKGWDISCQYAAA